MIDYQSKQQNIKSIKRNYIGKLGFISHDSPFIIPITYYFDEEENCIIAVTTEGHKIEGMRKNNSVCLLIEEINSLKSWKSVLISGKFQELSGSDSKNYLRRFSTGIKEILIRDTNQPSIFLNDIINKKYTALNTIVYKIKIWDITGRSMNE